MLEEAIAKMKKEKEMYEVLCNNFDRYGYFHRKVEKNKYRKNLIKEIKIRKFILERLEEQKKEGIDE